MSSGQSKAAVRESNVRVGQLSLVEHWRNPVFVLMKDNNPIINGVFEIFLTSTSLNQRVEQIEDKTSYSYCQVLVIQVVDAIFHQNCKGLSIHGLAEEELYITKPDLRPIAEQADTIVTMMAIHEERLKKVDALNRLEDRVFYILGQIPETFNKEEDLFAFDAKEMDDQVYVKLFLTEHRARMENDRNFEIGKYTLTELREAFRGRYGLIVESKEDYAVGFTAEEL